MTQNQSSVNTSLNNYHTSGGGHGWIRYRNSREGSCPLCGNQNSLCSMSKKTGLQHCRHLSEADRPTGLVYRGESEIGCSIWAVDNRVEWTDEEKKAWGGEQARLRRLEEEERVKRQANAGTAYQINKEYEAQYSRNPITAAHKQVFLDRGLDVADIERTRAYSVGDKLFFPIPNLDGDKLGAQIKITGQRGYVWDRAGRNKTKNHDELPIAIWGNRVNPDRVIFVEGTAFKPYLTARKFATDLVIGVSGGQFNSSAKQIREVLGKYPNAKLVLAPDGGSTFNSGVWGSYQGLESLITGLGRSLCVAWWKQFNKSDGDIDEIGVNTEIKYLEWRAFKSLSENGVNYKRLATSKKTLTVTQSSQYLESIELPVDGSMLFVSSPVGTGKTEQLISLCDRWEKIHDSGRIIAIGYRNGLLDQMSSRLNIASFRTGYGMDDLAIASSKRLAIVADSVLRLNLSDIPAGSLVILDEVEAVLRHCANARTMGDRAAHIQAHLAQIFDRVLMSGGAIVGLEDSITDLAIDGLLGLTDNKYPYRFIKNTYERFNWDVSIGGGRVEDFYKLIIARLKSDERIQLSVTSQLFGEKIERLALRYLPELEGKIERIDAKTINDKHSLVSDPVAVLRKLQTRLLILSPTVESGFSIDDRGIEPLFDRVMLYAANLDTRTHKQMLARYRSNCPREIFAQTKGAEANSANSLGVYAYLKKQHQLASETALEQGYGKIDNNRIGQVWNTLNASFSVRPNLSSKYLYEFLRHELLESGHEVSQVNWGVVATQVESGLAAPIDGDIKADLRAISEEIANESSTELCEADGLKMTAATANIVLRSSQTNNKQKTVAKKALLHHRLPGADLTKDFLRVAVVDDRGAYLRQCELSYLIDRLDLATAIDREIFGKQIQAPHMMLDRVPKNSARAKLLNPVRDSINKLVESEGYNEVDDSVKEIFRHALANKFKFWQYFGLQVSEPFIDSSGRTQNSPIHTVNKILKKLGWQSGRIKQLGAGKERVSIYAIANSDCQHRQTIYEALERRYATTVANAATVDITGIRDANNATHTLFKDKDNTLDNVCVDIPASLKYTLKAGYDDRYWQIIIDALCHTIEDPDYLRQLFAQLPDDLLLLGVTKLPLEQKLLVEEMLGKLDEAAA